MKKLLILLACLFGGAPLWAAIKAVGPGVSLGASNSFTGTTFLSTTTLGVGQSSTTVAGPFYIGTVSGFPSVTGGMGTIFRHSSGAAGSVYVGLGGSSAAFGVLNNAQSRFYFNIDEAGTGFGDATFRSKVTLKNGLFIVNDDAEDYDSRFEGQTDPNTIYLDASTNRVGLGTATPSTKLHVVGEILASSMTVINGRDPTGFAATAGTSNIFAWTETIDRLGEFVTSSFTVVLPGYYEVSVNSEVAGTASTGCIFLKKNGTAITGAQNCSVGPAAVALTMSNSLTWIENLAAADIISVWGSGAGATATFDNLTLSIRRLP